jgi:Ca2+-binding EF-hand superfamily protein
MNMLKSGVGSTEGGHQFSEADIPFLMDKIYQQFDSDNNQHFKKSEFHMVIRTLADLMGVSEPPEDDVSDLFNLLDVNGDETLDKGEFNSLLKTFFKLLKENDITVTVVQDTDILY